MIEWREVGDEEEGKLYLTKIDDGKGVRNMTKLQRLGGIWFVPDASFYVYYTPTHYREHYK